MSALRAMHEQVEAGVTRGNNGYVTNLGEPKLIFAELTELVPVAILKDRSYPFAYTIKVGFALDPEDVM